MGSVGQSFHYQYGSVNLENGLTTYMCVKAMMGCTTFSYEKTKNGIGRRTSNLDQKEIFIAKNLICFLIPSIK